MSKGKKRKQAIAKAERVEESKLDSTQTQKKKESR